MQNIQNITSNLIFSIYLKILKKFQIKFYILFNFIKKRY